jgi:hypothetical protein
LDVFPDRKYGLPLYLHRIDLNLRALKVLNGGTLMYKAFRKEGISLFAIAALVLFFAPSVPAREWGQGAARDIVGMDVTARHGGVVGKVEDVALFPDGRVRDVIIGLNGTDREVSVPMSSIRVHRDYVTYEGTRDELYNMASAYTRHGYYGKDGKYLSDSWPYDGRGCPPDWKWNLNPINPDLPACPPR